MSKLIEIKLGNKTIYRRVPDNYELKRGWEWDLLGDLTTSGMKTIGFVDIPQEKWDKIYKKGEKNDKHK